MSAELEVSQAGRDIANAIEQLLTGVAGEKMGFVLMVFPLDRKGECNYMANIDRADGVREIKALLKRWEEGQPDVPMHKKH